LEIAALKFWGRSVADAALALVDEVSNLGRVADVRSVVACWFHLSQDSRFRAQRVRLRNRRSEVRILSGALSLYPVLSAAI
jgi:hypothetical protein